MTGLQSPLLSAHGHPMWSEWGPLEWAIVAVGGAISLWVIWRAVRTTMRPGESEPDHVKRSILEDEDRALDPPPPAPDASAPAAPRDPPQGSAPPTARR